MNTSIFDLTRRSFLAGFGTLAGIRVIPALAVQTPSVTPQPYFASVNRAVAALTAGGQPIAHADAEALIALSRRNDADAVTSAETILDRYTLARVELAPNGYGQMSAGGAKRTLIEQGWQLFLLRVSNPAALTEKFEVSTNYKTPGRMSQPNLEQRAAVLGTLENAALIEKMWLLSQMQSGLSLSGFPVEYLAIELFSRDHGNRSAYFGAGAGNDQIAGRSYSKALIASSLHKGMSIDFQCLPSHEVTLSVLDTDGLGCMGSLTIRDKLSHVYPPQVMRIAPDMAFHAHIYRGDGENVRLPDGEYIVESWRGPEYLRSRRTVHISKGNTRIDVKLRRWIDPAKWGWYSGDTHIHAAGCSHYAHPTEGVSPETMIRHVRGEALSIGSALNWGPGWYYQKQFFSGRAVSPEAKLEHPDLQIANSASLKTHATAKDEESLLRYDVEVSGFPSSLSGHLVLLRLKEQDYPGTKLIEDWPSWNLPILKWSKAQGAVVGFAHCSAGMATDSTALPNYEIPPFNSVGTNEAIVDITHGAVDFLSGCEWHPSWELNTWYHMLNCGFRLAMLGETDYPCISDERPGVGRTYVRLDHRPTDDSGYDHWVQGIKTGRLYFGDGRSHFLQCAVNGTSSGDKDVILARAGSIAITATVAAWLESDPTSETEAIRGTPPFLLPAWHLERGRVGNTRQVAVEVVINGQAVDRALIVADGTPRPVRFKALIERSSWVALRIMPSAHTHPIFVTIAHKPIRASRRSAEWLRACVDKLWDEKHRLMRASERPAAAEAYDYARKTYDTIIAESGVA